MSDVLRFSTSGSIPLISGFSGRGLFCKILRTFTAAWGAFLILVPSTFQCCCNRSMGPEHANSNSLPSMGLSISTLSSVQNALSWASYTPFSFPGVTPKLGTVTSKDFPLYFTVQLIACDVYLHSYEALIKPLYISGFLKISYKPLWVFRCQWNGILIRCSNTTI